MLYFDFFFLRTGLANNVDCAELDPDLDCNTCTEDGFGTGTVTFDSQNGDPCQVTGTCQNGVCNGGK